MSLLRRFVPLLLASTALVSACSQAHTSGDDAGTDAPPTHDGSTTACGAVPFDCVTSTGMAHACSDATARPGCLEGGTWQCPLGMTPEPIVDCWCYGRAPGASCSCTPSGWSCPMTDAGTPGCPADPSSAEGTPCAPDGLSCGRCTDSCGFCNILTCSAGIWTRLEAPPPPPPCTSFDCGPELRCAVEREYCQHTVSDVGGEPDGYSCRTLPDGCPSTDDCDCITAGWSTCERGPEGGLEVVYPGG